MTRLGKELRDEALELADEFLTLVYVPSWARVQCYAKLAGARASSSTDFVYDVANAIDILDIYVCDEIKAKHFPQDIFDRLKEFYDEVKIEVNYSSDEEKFNSDTMLSDDPEQGEQARKEFPVGKKGAESSEADVNAINGAGSNGDTVSKDDDSRPRKRSLQDDDAEPINKRRKQAEEGENTTAGDGGGSIGESVEGEDQEAGQSMEDTAG